MRVKVRGIYTTALTKLLLENGFQIVQPSQAIKNRFCIPDCDEPPDIEIKDRCDLQGVKAIGAAEAIDKFQSIMHAAFEDAITRKWNISVDGIYKGSVVGENENAVYVQIEKGVVGALPKHEAPKGNRGEIIVQIQRKRMGRKTPVLSTQLKIVGNYAILAQKSNVGVSLKIRDINKRAELYALGKRLSPQGWGIIWREPAAHKSKDVLENEISALIRKVKTLNEKISSVNASSLLVEGSYFMDVEFPSASKWKMDMLRASVTPTIHGHHFYKSCGGKVSVALELAEKLLEKGQSLGEVEELFKRQAQPEFPEEGSVVDVEHVKLSGAVFHLGKAILEVINNGEIRYSRTVKTDGFYDGLGIAKEAGDKAVSETKPGEWHITTRYYSKDGKWKGTYININTPVELYPNAIRYIDLEVDVCICMHGETKILDMEKLEKAVEKGIISAALFEKVKANAERIAESRSYGT